MSPPAILSPSLTWSPETTQQILDAARAGGYVLIWPSLSTPLPGWWPRDCRALAVDEWERLSGFKRPLSTGSGELR